MVFTGVSEKITKMRKDIRNAMERDISSLITLNCF